MLNNSNNKLSCTQEILMEVCLIFLPVLKQDYGEVLSFEFPSILLTFDHM